MEEKIISMIIREATEKDLKGIQKLNYKLFELEYNSYDPALNMDWTFSQIGENYFKNILKDGIIFVATEEDRIIGYLAGSINIQTSYIIKSLAELDNCYVEEAYRNQGIGKKLLEEFKQYCIHQGIQEIKVTCSAKNINARKFYENNKFEDFEKTYKMKIGSEKE